MMNAGSDMEPRAFDRGGQGKWQELEYEGWVLGRDGHHTIFLLFTEFHLLFRNLSWFPSFLSNTLAVVRTSSEIGWILAKKKNSFYLPSSRDSPQTPFSFFHSGMKCKIRQFNTKKRHGILGASSPRASYFQRTGVIKEGENPPSSLLLLRLSLFSNNVPGRHKPYSLNFFSLLNILHCLPSSVQ